MIVVGNWKSQIHGAEILSWLDAYQDVPGVDQVMLAPFPYLRWLRDLKERQLGQTWRLGAQDVGVHESLPVTGEVRASMLADCGVQIVCVGHGESRRAFALTDDDLRARMNTVVAHGMIPLLCVGDVSESDAWLNAMPEVLPKECWIAYEPEWAIGQKHAASAERIEEHLQRLDASLKRRYNESVNICCIRLMYGGAVNIENIAVLSKVPGLDGFLVGRSSLVGSDWRALIQCI